MSYSLLGNLTDLYDDDLKSLFLVFKKVIELDNDAKDIFSQFKYVNDNRETFDNIIEGIIICYFFIKYIYLKH